jgi:hypothetical protein
MRKGGAAAMAHIDRGNRGGTIRYVAASSTLPAGSGPRASPAARTPSGT